MRTLLSIIAVSLVAFGCRSKEPTTLVVEENSPIVGSTDTAFQGLVFTRKERSQFVPIAKGIQRASSLILYQGLSIWKSAEASHPIEWNIVEAERDTTETLRIHGYDFYKKPLTVTQEEIEPLRHLSSYEQTFGQHTWKFCGPFHPDYALVWKDGKATYFLLLCFGCDEAKLFGPRSYVILDIYKVNVLKSILLAPRGQRSDD